MGKSGVQYGLAVTALVLAGAVRVSAATSTASATVTVNVSQTASLSLIRDSGSSTRGTATQIVFDRLDSIDMSGGSAQYMYAPYRSETGKNWHTARIQSNGSTLTLSAAVSGTVGGQTLASKLAVWCGGFWADGATTPVAGTASTDWQTLNGFSRTLNQAFVGVVPFNYRLDVTGVGAGSYTGTVTYTLVSN